MAEKVKIARHRRSIERINSLTKEEKDKLTVIATWHDTNGQHEIIRLVKPTLGTAEIRKDFIAKISKEFDTNPASITISIEFPSTRREY